LPAKYSFRELVGKKTLIIGDVGSGKTGLTIKLINEAVQLGFSSKITVIDIAPATVAIGGRKIGGRIDEFNRAIVKNIRYLAPLKMEAPRLSAKSAGELLSLIEFNRKQIEPLLYEYLKDPTQILFINEVSMYFQSKNFNLILSAAKLAETFIANGYYGKYFEFNHGTGVSKVERELMDLLAENMDVVIEL
jgi:nucleoside-triphosphatase THEP1